MESYFQDLSRSILKNPQILKILVDKPKKNPHLFNDCRSGWSKEPQWENECGSFLPCFLLVYTHKQNQHFTNKTNTSPTSNNSTPMKNNLETPYTLPHHKSYPYVISILTNVTHIMTSPVHKTPSKAKMVSHTSMTIMAST